MSDIKMTPIVEILRTVNASCDFDGIDCYPGNSDDERRTAFWMDVINRKASDTGFGWLVESILQKGFTGSAIGWDEDAREITEGHHRLVAAILLGMDEVPTTSWGRNGTHALPEGAVDRNHFSAHYNENEYPIFVEI